MALRFTGCPLTVFIDRLNLVPRVSLLPFQGRKEERLSSTTGLRTAVAVHFNILHSTTTGLRTAVAVHFNILHSTTTGLRTAVAVHFNILHSTTTGLRTAVAVHFNILHSTTSGLRTALAAFLSRTFGGPGILQLLPKV